MDCKHEMGTYSRSWISTDDIINRYDTCRGCGAPVYHVWRYNDGGSTEARDTAEHVEFDHRYRETPPVTTQSEKQAVDEILSDEKSAEEINLSYKEMLEAAMALGIAQKMAIDGQTKRIQELIDIIDGMLERAEEMHDAAIQSFENIISMACEGGSHVERNKTALHIVQAAMDRIRGIRWHLLKIGEVKEERGFKPGKDLDDIPF